MTGSIASRQAGVGGGSGIQNLSYWWDVNDNLIRREDGNQAPSVYEYFYYDNLDRIDYSQRNGVTNVDVAYDALGNVTSKSDVGSYTYDATKIHAVTAAGSNSYAYDANGNMTSRNGSTVNWFSYDLPMRIYAPGSVTYLQYGPDRSLWRQEATTSGVTETTTYVGEVVEKVTKDGVTTWKHYVEAPTGTAAVYLRRSGGTPAAETYYLTHDHLGSTDKVLDAAGGVVTVAGEYGASSDGTECPVGRASASTLTCWPGRSEAGCESVASFTALGARRGSTWQGTPTPAELAAIAATTRDGFTGHETLDSVGLVHMGGRVYDPIIGRFLSVDPVVRDIGAAQSWNSYGYVEGRVASWIDPTGWSGCAGKANKNCRLKRRDGERMLSRDSYRSVGGYWIDDDSPAWREFDGSNPDNVTIAARNPSWVSTGVDRGLLQQIDAGQGAAGERSTGEGGGGGGATGEPQMQQPPQVCTPDWNFDFGQFADQIDQNRVDLGATLGTLLATEAIGTMPKTLSELRGLGVARSELNPITSQLSRWSERLGARWMRDLGRTRGGVLTSGAVTLGLVFEGFYDIGTIGMAAWDATSRAGCGP